MTGEKKARIAVLVSGGGTNLQALIDARDKNPCGEIALVISSSPAAYALERARRNGIPAEVLEKKNFESPGEFDKALLNMLQHHHTDLVVLAGYMRRIGPLVLERYRGRILNVHPSLIPSFCGPGFYGIHVHEAVLGAGVKVTGATVHLVSEVVDGGEIWLQKAVDVLPSDTAETLQRRVMQEAEWELLPKAVGMLCEQIVGRNGEDGE